MSDEIHSSSPEFLLKPNPFEFSSNNSFESQSASTSKLTETTQVEGSSDSKDLSNQIQNHPREQSDSVFYSINAFGVLSRLSRPDSQKSNDQSSGGNDPSDGDSINLQNGINRIGHGVPGGGDCKKLCPRHQRMANEGTSRTLQSEIEKLPQSDKEAINTAWGLFSASNSNRRRLILSGILTMCCPSQLSFLTDSIKDACRTDPFIRLPKEVSLKILSYLDAFSLGRAAQVSRLWKKLADDDLLWRSMCQQHIERTCKTCGWGLPSMDKIRKRSCSTDHHHQKKLYQKRIKLDVQSTSGGDALSDQEKADEDKAKAIVCYEASQEHSKHSPSKLVKDMTKPWKAVYTERLALERNWRKGNCVEFVLTGHFDSITCSQTENITGLNGNSSSTPILITGSWDKSIKVWDLEKLGLVQTLIGHSRGVRCLQFDNCKLISGGMDRMLKIWNWRTGQCIRTIEGHSDSVTCLNYNEELLASGSSDSTIRIWNFKNGSGYVLIGHSEQVNCIKLDRSSSSRRLYSSSDDNQIRIWDLDRRQTIKVLIGHVAQVQSISLNRDCLISGSFDNCLKVWNINSNSNDKIFNQENEDHHHHRHHDNDNDDEDEEGGRSVVGNDGIDKNFGRCEKTMFGHIQGVWSVDSDRLRIVSGSHDRSLKIWDRVTGKCVHTLVGHRGAVTTVLLTDDRVISGGDDGEIRIWWFGYS